MDWAVNNLQWLICHKIRPIQYNIYRITVDNINSKLFYYVLFLTNTLGKDINPLILHVHTAGAVEYTE